MKHVWLAKYLIDMNEAQNNPTWGTLSVVLNRVRGSFEAGNDDARLLFYFKLQVPRSEMHSTAPFYDAINHHSIQHSERI